MEDLGSFVASSAQGDAILFDVTPFGHVVSISYVMCIQVILYLAGRGLEATHPAGVTITLVAGVAKIGSDLLLFLAHGARIPRVHFNSCATYWGAICCLSPRLFI
jgi:hypothetical protein